MDKRNTEPTLEINSAQKGDKSENAAGFGKMGSIDQAGTLNENTCTHHEQSQSETTFGTLEVDDENDFLNIKLPSGLNRQHEKQDKATASKNLFHDRAIISSTNKQLEDELSKLKLKNWPAPVYAGKDERVYHMRHSRRGKALIFNHEKFGKDDLSPRHGTEKDAQDLKKVLIKLGFEVQIYNDKSLNSIQQELEVVAGEDHTNEDCIIVAVMTHGVRTDENVDMLCCYDDEYPTHLILNAFDAVKCPTLLGKPKIFLIQACRVYEGKDITPVPGRMVNIISQTRGRKRSGDKEEKVKVELVNLPIMADIVIFRSTISSYPSFRNKIKGARFIQEFCNVFGSQDGIEKDFLSNCTTVIRNMTLKYGKNEQIQMPCVTSMLIRNIIFESN